MPQALIAVAEWVGSAIFASLPFSVPITTAATIAEAATIATLVVEVAAIAEVATILQPKIGGNFGTQVDFKADPQAGIPYAVGRTAVAGNIIFAQSAGAKSKYLSYATVYTGAGPIDSFESFLVNDVPVAFTADGGEGATGYYANRMWLVKQLGASPEGSYLHYTSAATGETPANHAGMPTEFSASHKLSGYAADLWGLGFNTDKYAAGTPKRLTVGKWVKVYDPRLDSTYPGGSGPQRLADESTWTWSENPYVHALTWLIGRRQNGKRIMGVGLPTAAIDFPAYVAGANVADANGWTCGGLMYSTDDKYEVLTAFLQAGGGKPMRLGAKMSCLVSTPRTSLATITSADVIADPTITGGVTRRGRINSIWPKYREEAQAWQQVTLDAPVSVASYVTEDGGQVRSRAVEYPLVQDATQVAQLAYYDIANSREFTPVVLPCKPAWMGYQPGDCITTSEAEWGLGGQKLLIVKRQRDPSTMQITLTCASETDAKHAAALTLSGTGPSTPGLSGIDPNVIDQPGAGVFTAAGGVTTGTTGTNPTLVVTGVSDNVNAVDVLVRYRLHTGPGAWIFWPAVHIDPAGVRIEITGVADNTNYDVNVAYRSGRGAISAWTDLGTKLAGALGAGGGTGDTIPPADVSAAPTVIIKQGFDGSGTAFAYLRATWPANTESDLDGYIVDINDGTHSVDVFAETEALELRGLEPGVTYTLKVKATDKSGNLSADWSATGAVTVGTVHEGSNLLYDGGFALKAQSWTLDHWGVVPNASVGPVLTTPNNGSFTCVSPESPATAGAHYTLSAIAATSLATAGNCFLDIQWLDAAHSLISTSAAVAFLDISTGGFVKGTFTAPALTAFFRVRIYSTALVLTPPGFAFANHVKVEAGDFFTGWNDDTTSGALYADGTTIDSLKPVDAGATKNKVNSSATTPAGPNGTGDFWVVLDGLGNPVAFRRWNGTAWVTPADLTSAGVAGGIAGQGPLATSSLTPSQVTNTLIPTSGQNRLRLTAFEKGVFPWTNGTNPSGLSRASTTGVSGGITFLQFSATATAAGQEVSMFTSGDQFAVTAGEQLAISMLAGSTNGQVKFSVQFFNAAGTFISSAPAFFFTAGATFPTLGQTMVTVPAGAVNAYMEAYIDSTAAGSMVAKIAQPYVIGVPTGQTAFPAYAPGASNTAGADVTLTNIASAVTGQGLLATKSAVDMSTSDVSNKIASNISYTGGTSVQALKPAQANADVTSSNTAAAFTGQGAWATYGGLSPTNVAGQVQFITNGGLIKDYRAILPGYAINGNAARSAQPLSSSSSSITVTAHTISVPQPGVGLSGEQTVSIPGTTLSGLASDTTYSVFYNPNPAPVFAATDPSGTILYKSSPDGWYELGSIRTQTSGGTYNPINYGSGGVSDYCVAVDAWVGEDLQARDLVVGAPLLMMAPSGHAAFAGSVERLSFAWARLLRFRTASGAVLTLSDSAPVMTRGGAGELPYAIRAADARPGILVPVALGWNVRAPFWEPVTSIEDLGQGEVVRISAGDGIFAAGDDPAAPAIFTHNAYQKP